MNKRVGLNKAIYLITSHSNFCQKRWNCFRRFRFSVTPLSLLARQPVQDVTIPHQKNALFFFLASGLTLLYSSKTYVTNILENFINIKDSLQEFLGCTKLYSSLPVSRCNCNSYLFQPITTQFSNLDCRPVLWFEFLLHWLSGRLAYKSTFLVLEEVLTFCVQLFIDFQQPLIARRYVQTQLR